MIPFIIESLCASIGYNLFYFFLSVPLPPFSLSSPSCVQSFVLIFSFFWDIFSFVGRVLYFWFLCGLTASWMCWFSLLAWLSLFYLSFLSSLIFCIEEVVLVLETSQSPLSRLSVRLRQPVSATHSECENTFFSLISFLTIFCYFVLFLFYFYFWRHYFF